MTTQNTPPPDGLAHEESGAPKLPGEDLASGERSKSGKSRVIFALVMMLLLVCGAVWLASFMLGSKNTANVRVKKQQEQKEGAERDAELNAQIASLRQAMTTTALAPGAEKGVIGADGAKSGHLQPDQNLASTLAPPRQFAPPSGQEKSGEKGAEQDRDPSALMGEMSARAPSHRNPERSIRFAAQAPTPSVKGKASSAEAVNAESTVKSTSRPLAVTPVNAPAAEKPPLPLTKATAPKFGAMLPVQLMGVLYTMRQGSLARLQLMRDVRGAGWQLKRGTIFLGEVRESALDRAYIQIKGYIDPESDRFVALGGEILGSDGASGVRGKRHKLTRAWTRVLDRLANAAIQTAQRSLGRNQAIIIGGDPYGIYRDAGILGGSESSLKEFVEVAAGSVGFVLVTDLPRATRHDQQSQRAQLPTEEISDAELAEILESDDPGRLRAALPRMSLSLKNMAEQVLREIAADKK